MIMNNIALVILAGGFGTRLWPVSRKFLPKQFVRFFKNEDTLFQNSVKRVRFLDTKNKIFISCNIIHIEIIKEQLKKINEDNYLLIIEESSRNTFPSILSVLSILQKTNKIVSFFPSDHIVGTEKFVEDLKKALDFSKNNNKLTLIGIKPTEIKTDYGYIEQDSQILEEVFTVKKFKEKPNLETAKKYLESENYYWNSGIFIIPIKNTLEEIKNLEFNSYNAGKELNKEFNEMNQNSNLKFFIIKNEIFSKMKQNSIDYILIEKLKEIYFYKASFYWNDLGSWKSFFETYKEKLKETNNNKNTIINTTDTCILNNSHLNISAIGMKNTIIVAENDSILILNKENSQDVKDLNTIIEEKDKDLALYSTMENRPWGFFNIIFRNSTTKIKELTIFPQRKISLQSHKERSEHWIITEGIATIELEGKISKLSNNQSIFIEKNKKHRIENKEQTVLKIIEIQIGESVREDDIIRYEDEYGRVNLL